MTRDQRRLAAIVSADVVGYSLLMGRDDSATLAGLKAHRRELIDSKIAEYGGRIVKTTGDGLLLEFPSVVDAVRCSVDVQRGMVERNAGVPPEQRIEFRIEINVGDIIIDGDDIFGDGVNVASRLQTLAEPGGICVSRVVRDQVLDKLSFAFEDLGSQQVKNIARPVDAYKVDLGSSAQAPAGRERWRRLTRGPWRWLAVGVIALGVVGIAVWTLPKFWKTAAPAPIPPALSVAITPLAASHGDADASQFAEALTRDLMTGLPRKRFNARVVVVSGRYGVGGATGPIDVRDLGRSLNVRYVLEGDVLRGGDGDTVNLRLVNAATGEQIWSERDTLRDSDVSSASSAKLRELITQLHTGLYGAEIQRVMSQPESGLSAPELLLRASAVYDKDQSLAGTREALKLVDEALHLDPNLAPALTKRAVLINYEGDVDPNQDRERVGREQDDLTARAVDLDPTDASAWVFRAVALEYLGRWDSALEAGATAIKLDPYWASSYVNQAWIMNTMGRPAEALPLIDRGNALNPNSGGWIECQAHLFAGHAEEAIATCEKAVSLDSYWFSKLFLVAAYANHGDMDKAAAVKADVLRVVPGYTIAQLRAKRYSDHPEYQRLAEKYWYEGLRKAGIPEN